MAQAKNSSNNYEYKINKDELNELTSSERKLLADIEKKVAEYTVQKANIDKQYQTKLMQLQQKKNSLNNILKRAMGGNTKISLRAASIYHSINSSN